MHISSNHHNPFCATGNLCFLVRNHKEECVCCSARLRKPVFAAGKTFEILCGFPNIECLMVKQLKCPHAKHHPQTGTHIQSAPHLSHRYTSALFIIWSHRLWVFWTLCMFYAGSVVKRNFEPPTTALTGIGQTKQYSTLQKIARSILTRKNAPLIISPL